MLVKGNQRPQAARVEPVQQKGGGGLVSLADAVRDLLFGRAGVAQFLLGSPESQPFGLGEDVGVEQIVLMRQVTERLDDGDEVAGDQLRSLVEELIERPR